MAEELFWQMVAHLKTQSPGFAAGQRRGPAFRFKLPIHVIDSATLELTARNHLLISLIQSMTLWHMPITN